MSAFDCFDWYRFYEYVGLYLDDFLVGKFVNFRGLKQTRHFAEFLFNANHKNFVFIFQFENHAQNTLSESTITRQLQQIHPRKSNNILNGHKILFLTHTFSLLIFIVPFFFYLFILLALFRYTERSFPPYKSKYFPGGICS